MRISIVDAISVASVADDADDSAREEMQAQAAAKQEEMQSAMQDMATKADEAVMSALQLAVRDLDARLGQLARAAEGRVDGINAVGGADDNHAATGLQAVLSHQIEPCRQP